MEYRKIVLDLLFEVFSNNKFSNKLLNKISKTKAVSSQDMALVFKLVYGVIDYKIYLEYVTNKFIDPNKTPYKIQILFWICLYQVKFLNSKIHYVVNETVEISKTINQNLSGLVNRVCKLICEPENQVVNIKNKQNVFPLTNGFPFWLFKKFEKEFGIDIAKQIVNSTLEERLISFRVNTLKITVEKFEKQFKDVFNFKKSNLVEEVFLIREPIMRHEVFDTGFITIQDQSSALAVKILNPDKNKNVLDMCCAPGGKLTHISALMNNTGHIDAYELNPLKIELVNQNLKRLDIKNVNLICKDVLQADEKEYDYILLDAPCSGYGVIKRKPEIKLKKYSDQKVDELILLQQKMLDKAYKTLKVGGTMVYSTCTINKDENQNQINWFLNKYNNLSKEFEQQLFGFEFQNDGFYICKIIKK